jgi:hypothetical protein
MLLTNRRSIRDVILCPQMRPRHAPQGEPRDENSPDEAADNEEARQQSNGSSRAPAGD